MNDIALVEHGDIDAGRDATLFAYQRSNVAELNRLAREVMLDSGRVSGPEVHGLTRSSDGRIWIGDASTNQVLVVHD